MVGGGAKPQNRPEGQIKLGIPCWLGSINWTREELGWWQQTKRGHCFSVEYLYVIHTVSQKVHGLQLKVSKDYMDLLSWGDTDSPCAHTLCEVVTRPVWRGYFTLLAAKMSSTWSYNRMRQNRIVRRKQLFCWEVLPSSWYNLLPFEGSTPVQLTVKPVSTTLSLEEKLIWSLFPSVTRSWGGTGLHKVPVGNTRKCSALGLLSKTASQEKTTLLQFWKNDRKK